MHAGDSTSRVPPVKQLDGGTYWLEFEGPFAFVPDSLVHIVQTSLRVVSVSLDYSVQVVECSSQETVYGFQIGDREQTTIVPCLGREQPKGCYNIVFSYVQPGFSAWPHDLNWLVLSSIGFTALGFVGRSIMKKKIPTIHEFPAVKIGRYEFSEANRILKMGDIAIDLSDKESQLLKIFASRINQPVTREVLMREVWQDNGVLVSRSLDVFVSRLRKKLKSDTSIQLLNIHGVGYKLVVAPAHKNVPYKIHEVPA